MTTKIATVQCCVQLDGLDEDSHVFVMSFGVFHLLRHFGSMVKPKDAEVDKFRISEIEITRDSIQATFVCLVPSNFSQNKWKSLGSELNEEFKKQFHFFLTQFVGDGGSVSDVEDVTSMGGVEIPIPKTLQ